MRRLAGALAAALLALASCTPDPADDAAPAPAPAETDPAASQASSEPAWELVFEDEFDGPAGQPPDPRWWNHEIGGDGWGNQELQYYTDDPAAASLDGDGHLVITAAEVPAEDETWCWYGECRYTSARLTTQDKVEAEYGRIEVRARMPQGAGMWAAFWMLGADFELRGWPNSGEIDIVEYIGREPDLVHGTVHGPTYSGADGIGGRHQFEEGLPYEAFHTYAIEWEPERIRWYVDDDHYATLLPGLLPDPQRWVFDGPFFLLLNLAVGGQWPGPPSEDTTFPQTFTIDHVRVYREGNDGA